MIKSKEGNIRVLEAEHGFLLSNGEIYGKKVYLAPCDDEETWYETEEV